MFTPNTKELSWIGSPTTTPPPPSPTPNKPHAVPIIGLYNTGVKDDGSVLLSGSPDPHYRLLLHSNKPYFEPIETTSLSTWPVNNTKSSWVGWPVPQPPGKYKIRTEFNLDKYDPQTTKLKVIVTTDNHLEDIILNETSLGLSFKDFTGWSREFNIDKGFSKNNKIDFVWINDSESPTGINIILNGTAIPITQPPHEGRGILPKQFHKVLHSPP